MSREAMEAVLLHSPYTEPDDHYKFRLMMAIASFADSQGIAGVKGNHRRCAGVRALAERANMHRNTVIAKLPELVADGVLALERGGSGRGLWTVYTIALPVAELVPLTEERHTVPENASDNSHVPLLERMAHDIERMAHGMAHLEQLMAHQNGTNGTRLQGSDVPVTMNDHRENMSDLNARATAPAFDAIRQSESPEQAETRWQYITAISAVVKDTLWERTQESFESAAEALIRDGVTIAQVDAFGPWWQRHSYYHDTGKASLTTFVQEIRNSIAGVKPRASPNGNGKRHVNPDVDERPERVGGVF